MLDIIVLNAAHGVRDGIYFYRIEFDRTPTNENTCYLYGQLEKFTEGRRIIASNNISSLSNDKDGHVVEIIPTSCPGHIDGGAINRALHVALLSDGSREGILSSGCGHPDVHRQR